ncbi:MAG: SprB repeat-containing protein, partial [Bacteroidales bacterium]|nr:SprB repeat-containing protein [Bacteroidales bacterium]
APTATATGKAVPIGTGGIGSNESAGNIAYNAATNLQRAIVVNGGVRYDSGNREGFKIPSGGCPATASVNVTIDVAPTLSLYSGSTSQDICVDNSIGGIVYHYTPTSANASVSGLPSGVTYTASSGVLSIHGTPTASGNFGYTVTVPAGSCPPATLEGTINVADKLMVAVNSPQVCKGSSVTLQASGAATYSWSPITYLSGTGNSVSFSSASSSVVAGNSYTVTVTGTSGNCRNSAVATVSVVGKVTPTFTNPGPYCEGATPASLPSCTAVDPVSGSVITGSWNPNTISTSSSGTNTYTFNVTSGQCANNGSVSVVVNALPTVGITPSATTICTGSQEVLTATAGYSNYAWSNGSATAGTATGNTYRITPITAGGTYSVTVTDGNGCQNNTTVAITVKDKVTPTFDAASYCIGDNANYPTCTTADPITNTLISGSWPTTPISTASAGTTDYTFTVNSGQCANDGTLSVTVVNCCDISVSDITYTDPTCYGGNNGTATVTVDGGTAPFTYLWSDGETTTSNVRDDLPAGAYSVTVRDANGCESGRETTNECFRITDIMYHSCNANHLEGFNEMFTMLIGPNDLDADNMGITWATGSLNFTGFCENQAAVDGINAIITGGGHIIAPVNGILPANSEVLVVTSQLFDYESFGFAGLDHDVYILFQCNESVTTGHFGNTPDGSTRTFSVSFTSPSCSDEVSYYTTTNSPGDAVHYNADGTVDYYNNGCQAPVFYNEIVLSDPEEITLSYSSISGYQNVDLGGISPVTNCTGTAEYTSTDLPDGLALDYSTGVITGTPEHQEDGSFSVTMTCDGCEAHYTVDYHFDVEPDYQGCVIDEDFSEITTGGNTATSGTNGPLGTELTPNFISDFPTTSRAYAAGGVVKLGSGSYSGFIQTVPLNLSVPFYVEFDVKGWTTVEGDIIVTVSGGETQTVSYTATIGGDFEHKRINFNAATSTSTVTIATFAKRAFIDNVKVCYPDPCSVEARQIAGVCEGKIIIEAEGSGGMGEFSYAWDNGAGNAAQYNGAVSGTTYTVVATDEVGCTAEASVTPVQTGNPEITPSFDAIICNEGTTDIVLTVTGGVGEPYTYHWEESTSTTNTIENVIAGTYHVTVSDANCSAESTISVTEPDAVTFDVTTTPQVCNTPGTATVSNEQGGNGTYSYEWSNSSTVASVELTSGNYSVTVRDGNDCSASAAVTVGSSSTSVSFSATPSNPTCSYQTGSIVVNNFVGASPYTVAWDGGSVDNITGSYTITNLVTGNYTVTVTDADGCGDTHTGISITVPSEITFTVSSSPQICTTLGSATVEIANSGNYSYVWHNSANEVVGTNSNVLSDVNAGTYSVTVTSTATGCSATGTGTVGSSSTSVSFDATPSSPTCSYQTGSIVVNNFAGASPYT